MIFTLASCGEEASAIDISGVKFESITVEYDGEAHAIECTNVPEGVTVTYFGNGARKVGEHKVTAVLKDSNGNELGRLRATITITGEEAGNDPATGGEENPDVGGDDNPSEGGNDNPDLEPSGYTIAIGEEVYDLYLLEEAGEDTPAQYYVDVYVYADDAVVAYDLEGNVITSIGDERGEEGNTNNVLGYADNMKILVEGDVTVYFKVYADGGYSLWVTGNDEVVLPSGGNNGGNSGEAGDVKYQILINGSTVVDLIYEGPWNMDSSYEQHHAFGVELEAGDVITFKNVSTGEEWALKTIDSASSGGMTYVDGQGIVVGTTGTYDIYVKTKWEADNVYFGPAA